MYQNGITAPSIRPPWEWASWLLSSGRALKIGFMTKATENSTPTIRPTVTMVITSSALSMLPLPGSSTASRCGQR